MPGLLYSHVDPPNSLVCMCLCLLSEGQWIRTPSTCTTQLAGHPSAALHSCQSAGPARFIIVSEFPISRLVRAKVDADVVSDKLLYRTETPTGPFHIHDLI